MKRFSSLCLVICCAMASILALSQPRAVRPQAESPSLESKATIEGLVRDVACPIQNLEATATQLSMKCLVACARVGSPLVILTKDGELYLPISGRRLPCRMGLGQSYFYGTADSGLLVKAHLLASHPSGIRSGAAER